MGTCVQVCGVGCLSKVISGRVYVCVCMCDRIELSSNGSLGREGSPGLEDSHCDI